MCNFKNVCKTLAVRCQIRQAFSWLKASPLDMSLEVGTGSSTVIWSHPEFHELFTTTSEQMQDAFLANYVSVFGTRYEPGLTVILDMTDESCPVFGYIDKILVCSGVINFSVRLWSVFRFQWKTRSYLCDLSEKKMTCTQKLLLDFHPLYAHQCLVEDCPYYHIRLRHLLCTDK